MGKKITVHDVEKWNEMRNRGYSLKDIGKEFCTSPKTVGKYLNEVNVTSQEAPNLLSNSKQHNLNSHSISDIEKDPDILKMKKQLEIAKLKHQIREAEAPLELENKLKELEERMSEQEEWCSQLPGWMKMINEWKGWVNNTLAIRIQHITCEVCGAKGKIALQVECNKCCDRNWYFTQV